MDSVENVLETKVDSKNLERRAGIEPAYTGFADLRVSRFATGACENSFQLSVVSKNPTLTADLWSPAEVN